MKKTGLLERSSREIANVDKSVRVAALDHESYVDSARVVDAGIEALTGATHSISLSIQA